MGIKKKKKKSSLVNFSAGIANSVILCKLLSDNQKILWCKVKNIALLLRSLKPGCFSKLTVYLVQSLLT